ncbi:MAG: ankyrin repeat domain-containing protein [Campylobacterota bacterium]|nr:ankyrin repeat domain-containing protein [Campylobacterota bacterium]
MRWLLILLFGFSLMASELHLAVKKLDQKLIVKLLKSGADINAVDEKGDTPLHIATRIGRYSVVSTLLKYKPDLYIENHKGYTPLAIAIHYNYVKSIQALVKAQKHQERKFELPELHQAVADNSTKSVKKLLRQGVPVDSHDSSGRTALQLAAREGSLEMVRVLILAGADVMHVDHEGRDVLYFARYGKNRAVINLIVEEKKKRGSK